MIRIQFPEPDFRIKKENGRTFIYDTMRKKWIGLTPEEWVRQNFVQYLVKVEQYPAALIAIEKELLLGELKKRFDVLIYDKEHRPWMMIECKSMEVELNEDALEQALRYNISIPVPYIIVTNGSYCAGFSRKTGALEVLEALPAFGE